MTLFVGRAYDLSVSELPVEVTNQGVKMKHRSKLALRRRGASVAALGLLMLVAGTGTVLAEPDTLVIDPAAGDDVVSLGFSPFAVARARAVGPLALLRHRATC